MSRRVATPVAGTLAPTPQERGRVMFEFVCDRIIPGCSHKETGDTPEAVREKAVAHLHQHHDLAYIDADLMEKLDGVAIIAVR